jgi:hypothetical protein
MSIFTYIAELFETKLKTNDEGLFTFSDVRTNGDISALIDEISHLPKRDDLDIDWIISGLTEIQDDNSEGSQQFIETYQKIGVGKTLYHEGKAEELVDHLIEMYPTVKFENMKAVGYK